MTAKLMLAAILATAAAMPATAQAPQGSDSSLYCMWVEPETGSLLEEVQCWTRAEWAEADVDVDAEWATEGVRVIG